MTSRKKLPELLEDRFFTVVVVPTVTTDDPATAVARMSVRIVEA
jgi:hypothetical protein